MLRCCCSGSNENGKYFARWLDVVVVVVAAVDSNLVEVQHGRKASVSFGDNHKLRRTRRRTIVVVHHRYHDMPCHLGFTSNDSLLSLPMFGSRTLDNLYQGSHPFQ